MQEAELAAAEAQATSRWACWQTAGAGMGLAFRVSDRRVQGGELSLEEGASSGSLSSGICPFPPKPLFARLWVGVGGGGSKVNF